MCCSRAWQKFPFNVVFAALATVTILLCAACEPSPDSPEDVEKQILNLGLLPGLRADPNRDLQDELARIEAEHGTPAQLVEDWPADADNVAVALVAVFNPNRLEQLDKSTSKFIPQGRFRFREDILQRLLRMRRGYADHQRQIREALELKKCDFKIDFKQGDLADLSFLQTVSIAVRLEAFDAAEALYVDQDPSRATVAVGRMMRLAELLASEIHPAARITAAHLRSDALTVLAEVAGHDKTTRTIQEQLLKMITAQLANWPDDDRIWIGDRAIGLHFYEMVRDGQLTSLLSMKEVEQLRVEGKLRDLDKVVRRTIADDQVYYLATMRKIIDSCQDPYYKRRKLFDNILSELHKMRELESTEKYPMIADRYLLRDIQVVHRLQALDRAACEVVALGLANALGKTIPPYVHSPVSGEAYHVRIDADHITVRDQSGEGEGRNRSIIVPILKAP